MPDQPLRGLSVLVLEDEFLIAMDIEEACREAGAADVTILSRMDGAKSEAAALDGHGAAVLDLHLGGVSTLPVAKRLAEQGVPFVFATGYSPAGRDLAAFPTVPLIGKPFAAEALVEALAGEVRRLSGG